MTACAVWYWHYGSPDYELCASEEEAASFAVGLEDSGNGSVKGVQFEDGRFVERDAWGAYEARERQQDELAKRMVREAAAQPKPATRQVGLPFDPSRKIHVLADAPPWLGAG